ncbi:unnamed protein product [Paramecium primaurelia]|uniref:Actin, cytoplasmic n=1 Tax=Paramecium primaurelia TaxID=5886 RepID=A0A8S1LCZ6_PARPR|nr:unnamed protein product [Paramecium primaurelia]
MFEDAPAVVIDNGSYELRAGFAGYDDHPKCCFSTVVGRPKHQGNIFASRTNQYYIGNDVQAIRGLLTLKYPIDNGIVINWDDMEIIWHHAFFKELNVQSEEHPALMTEISLNPKYNRQKMIQVLFESFNVPQFYSVNQAVLSLYASGRTTGIVVDSGYGASHIVPIYEGSVLNQAVCQSDLAGRACTKYLDILLNQLGISISSSSRMNIVGNIKEQFCYVALDYEQEMMENKQSVVYILPDENTLVINKERFKCPELLFNPCIEQSNNNSGIHELLQKSIMKSDIDFRRDFYQQIVLSGGNTLIPGFANRLNKELKSLAPSNMKIKINASFGKFSAWIGGQIFSKIKPQWIQRSEYDEYGPNIIHLRCF